MSYATIEARVKLLLEGLTGVFPSTNLIARGDYRELDSGASTIAVLTPGAFVQDGIGEGGARKSVRNWSVLIDLFKKYIDDGTSWTDFADDRDTIMAELEKFPSLNSLPGVVQVIIAADIDPGEIFDEDDNGPFFLWQRLRVNVTERADLIGGEF